MGIKIPVDIGLSVLEGTKAEGTISTLDRLLDGLKGKTVNTQINIDAKGVRELQLIEDELADIDPALKKLIQSVYKFNSISSGSVTSLRQSVNSLKQQRDALNPLSQEWGVYSRKLQEAQANLRSAQGIQTGSLTDLRRQREELIKLRDATARFPSGPGGGGGGPTWNDLNNQIKALDGSINKITPGFSNFFSVLGKIATVQAGFIALTSALSAIGGVINAYVGRTKQIEAFNLALKNVGLTQAATSAAFKDATAIANRLGAPVQQVEKSYQRMVPALKAVGASSATTSKFIENITARTQTLGLNTEESGRLLEAFAQVLSKGKLQSEELNQQISELDGAFRTQLADALGVTVSKLTELVEAGQVTAPVFVDAVNKMANGADELAKRIRNGTATIQQLQNGINNVNVQILSEIGKQLEPGIKAFLRLSLAVAEFFKGFTQTETFKTFSTIFNQSAKGIEVFVTNLLKIIQVINALFTPVFTLLNAVLGLGEGFGGLIGLIINLVGGLVILKGAILAFNFIKGITASVAAFRAGLLQAGQATNYLSTQAKPGSLLSYRQALENVRASSVGLFSQLKSGAASFLGVNNQSTASGKALRNAGVQSSYFAGGLRFAGEAAKTSTGELGKVSRATYGVAVASQQATGSIRAAGAALAGPLAGALKQVINPVTIGIAVVGALIQTFQAGKQEAESVRQSYAGAFAPLNEELARVEKEAKKVPPAIAQVSGSLKDNASNAEAAGNNWRLGAVALGVLAVGATIVTGGLAGVAIAAVAAGGSLFAASKASAELGKSEFGKQLIKSANDFSTKLGSVESRIKGLGGTVGQVDFSNFAAGSKNLVELKNSYIAAAAGIKEKIDADKQQLEAERAKQEPNQAAIKFLEDQISKNQQALQATEASVNAIKAETASRIANGDAVALATASVDELKDALEQQNAAIDVSKTNAQTEALKKYGQTAAQVGQLESANLGIELAATDQRIAANQRLLNALEEKKAKGQEISAEDKKFAAELTKTIAEETKNQVEIQKQLGEAIVAGFEKGIQKARELAGVYGQIAQGAKQTFDAISGSASSAIGNAVGLVDSAAQLELQGLEKGSQLRQQIIQQQLQAQARANQAEFEIARFKLDVSNRIAQNEARAQQIRLQAEAKIAAAKGDFGLAQAYSEAAAAQGQVISGLQTQLQIEAKSLELQKLSKDNQIAYAGVQEGLNQNAVVQTTNLQQATAELQGLVGNANRLTQAYGGAAVNASNFQVAVENTQEASGSIEAQKVRQAFDEAKNSVQGLNKELSKTKDPVFAALDAAVQLKNTVAEAKRLLEGTGPRKGAPARALGGPVTAGTQYFVNDGGGREGFLNKLGRFSMLPAGRNLNWTAPTSGTVIPAGMVDQYRQASVINKEIEYIGRSSQPKINNVNQISSTLDSGNLIQRVASAMSTTGNTQRITNNVTIQSQQPVTDASRIMTNVARMKLRSAGRI